VAIMHSKALGQEARIPAGGSKNTGIEARDQ